MTVINMSPNRLIQIGYEGEDKVTILRFSYSEKWLENGVGIFTVRVLRNGENQAYNAQVIKDDRENFTIDMTVTDVELSKKGYGEIQLVYTGADFVKKSSVYKYYVSRSVDEAVDPPESDIYTQIIESLSDLRTNFDELANTVNEINDDIGDLTELTTANKLNIVESINEVNSKSSVSVDGELSDVSTNPVQNKVIASRITSVESAIASAQTAIQGKADIQTVSALSDAVNWLDSDIQGLQTAVQAKADTATVTSLSGTVSDLSDATQQYMEYTSTAITNLRDNKANKSYVDDELATKANAQTVTALSGTVSGLQTSKADKSYVDTQLAEKASAQTVSDLSDDVSDLQTAIQGKADTATVTALSGTVSSLQTTVQSKADAQTVTALSGTVGGLRDDVNGLQTRKVDFTDFDNLSSNVTNLWDTASQYMEHTEAALDNKVDVSAFNDLSDTVTGLQTSKADKSYVDTELAGKASTATATTSTNGLMSAQDKAKLDAVYADYTSALTALGGGS